MFCSHCGAAAQSGSRFCGQCGAPLLAPDVTSSRRATGPVSPNADVAAPRSAGVSSARMRGALVPPTGAGSALVPPASTPAGAGGAATPKEQLQALKLELKRLKLELREVNAQMAQIRSHYNETSAFVPGWALRHGYKEIEDARLLGPQQRKQALQQSIFRLEENILALESEAAG